MSQRKLTLPQWIDADTQQRAQWMAVDGLVLDERSMQILTWALAFNDAGGNVPESVMRIVYFRTVHASLRSYR